MQYDMTKQKLKDQNWPKKEGKETKKKQRATFLHTQVSYKELNWKT